jgi:hypothetical protein
MTLSSFSDFFYADGAFINHSTSCQPFVPYKKKPATKLVAGFTIRSLTPLVTTLGCQIIASTIDGSGRKKRRRHSPPTTNPSLADLPPGDSCPFQSINSAVASRTKSDVADSRNGFFCADLA